MIVSNLRTEVCLQFVLSLLMHVFLNSVVTIGFSPATYSVDEDAGSVSVTVGVLSGTLARGVSVVMVTSLNDGTATGGILNVCVPSGHVFMSHFSSLCSYGGL